MTDVLQIITNVSSILENIFIKDNFVYLESYKYLFEITIDIQKTKTPNIRTHTLNVYKSILKHVETEIDLITHYILSKIQENTDMLYSHNLEFYNFINKLDTCDRLFDLFKNQIIYLTDDYKPINFRIFGISSWITNISSNFINTLLNEIECSIFEYKEIDENSIYDFLENIYLYENEAIIEINFFKTNIEDKILDMLNNLLNSMLIELDKECFTICAVIDKIDTNFFRIINTLNNLNLAILTNQFKEMFQETIIKQYQSYLEKNFKTILNYLNFEKQNENDIPFDNIDPKILHTLGKIIYFVPSEFEHYKNNITDYFTNYFKKISKDYNNVENINDILKLGYFIKYIYEELCSLNMTYKYNINVSYLFSNVTELFEKEIKNIDVKIITKTIDKYIKNNLYLKKGLPKKYFIDFFKIIIKNRIDDEIMIMYLKNYLIKRIYNNRHSISNLEIEICIIQNLGSCNKCPTLHNINCITTDLSKSLNYSKEFSKIYNIPNNTLVITNGLWNINPKDYEIKFESKLIDSFNKYRTRFKEYYNCKYENKKLEWNLDLTTVIVTYNDKNIDIECNLNQLCILEYFNDHDTLSIENCPYPKDDITYLGKNKILRKNKNKTHYILNSKFDSKDMEYINVTHKKTEKKNTKKIQ